MGDLLDDLANIRDFAQRRGTVCSVGVLLENLSPAEAEALAARLDDAGISAGAIMKVLERHGHKIPAHTIRRHRRRASGEGCACR